MINNNYVIPVKSAALLFKSLLHVSEYLVDSADSYELSIRAKISQFVAQLVSQEVFPPNETSFEIICLQQ